MSTDGHHDDGAPARLIDDAHMQDWLQSFDGLVAYEGSQAAVEMLSALEARAEALDLKHRPAPFTSYRNTISAAEQPPYPGDLQMEERLTAIMRWNALAMVMRANRAYGDLGGHIASYASVAEIFEVGFNHFFRGGPDGDLVYFQPHSAPGVYSRAYLEGRLSDSEVTRYRQELDDDGRGLCSYPHPWLMPDFWQFPTGSMGLGPLSAVYSARFMRYLAARGLANTDSRHVWGVFGDGEMDEPESIAGLSLAARESLDNLTFVVNCNLQRLDGPVRGNGQIIQELEALFHGAGWNVIKVLWGGDWDALFARDTRHALLRRFAATVDGKYQTLGAKDGAYNLKHFFEEDPEAAAVVRHMTDAEIDRLRRGGHDFEKLYAAFHAAKAHQGQPTVILAKTKKGFGMGRAGESRMTAHQAKTLDVDALKDFRDRFDLPLTDAGLEALDFVKPAETSPEVQYLQARRTLLGGPIPERRAAAAPVAVPELSRWAAFAMAADGKEMSSTMAFVRMLGALLKDPALGPRIAPIVADEARTFGMASLFRQIGIYAPDGQLYEPEDSETLLRYHEAADGQLLEEGITEAGALSSWTAAATSYSTHGVAMLPFYIYYSMFGFQRVGDLIWAAADQRARGFLIGATAGRTTLSGEGLQHQDGSSHLTAASIPNCRAYDPCYAYEVAILVEHGARRMLEVQEDAFYYLTTMNEAYANPSAPPDAAADVIRGMHRLHAVGDRPAVRLLGSGAVLREVEAAAELLEQDWGVGSEVFSVTSFSELEREAREAERRERLDPATSHEAPHVRRLLPGDAPVIAATDYVRAVPSMIAPYVDAPFTALGTDGFGRSDTRSRLRAFFEVDRRHVAVAALARLSRQGRVPRAVLAQALERYGVDGAAPAPWTR